MMSGVTRAITAASFLLLAQAASAAEIKVYATI